ncbi:MAG: response regulator [Cyclobacteriaceae bacterium]|nr:response regulator [Cyclobacteriaceae bacterium]
MIRCLIVEDEPLAADVLADYIGQVPSLALKAVCADAIQAMERLQQEPIDLLFLDIHLPGLKGLDFLQTLSKPPRVIITTAYHEYALKGYELNVVDYLLKPIEFKRFLQAISKVQAAAGQPVRREVITLVSDKKKVLVPTDEILYVESQKEYIHVQTKTGVIVSKYALSRLEGELDARAFLRIHRSFIISLDKITAFSQQEVEVAGKRLPVGGLYRDAVAKVLGQRFGQSQ